METLGLYRTRKTNSKGRKERNFEQFWISAVQHIVQQQTET